jgi:hypothetical protein
MDAKHSTNYNTTGGQTTIMHFQQQECLKLNTILTDRQPAKNKVKKPKPSMRTPFLKENRLKIDFTFHQRSYTVLWITDPVM